MRLSSIFPVLTVFEDFFSKDALNKIRNIFEKNNSKFLYQEDKVASTHNNCLLKIWKIKPTEIPIIESNFYSAFLSILEKNNFKSSKKLNLNFNEIFLKQYSGNDHYDFHVDQSNSGLSFLFQFGLEDDHAIFSPLIFKNGNKVEFKNNQLIVFHSYEMHGYFPDIRSNNTKGIILGLPSLVIE